MNLKKGITYSYISLAILVMSCQPKHTPLATSEDSSKAPLVVKAFPKTPYVFNSLTGDSITPATRKNGEIIKTGVPIPIPEKNHSNSVSTKPPRKFKIQEYPKSSGSMKNGITDIENSIKLNFNVCSETTAISTHKCKMAKKEIDSLYYNQITLTGQKVKVKPPYTVELNEPIIDNNRLKDVWSLNKASGMSNDFIHDVYLDSRNHIWLMTSGSGISKFDGTSFHHYSSKSGLETGVFNSIEEDSNGGLWFCTNLQGVYYYDGLEFTHFHQQNGLLSNNITNMFKDAKGQIWLATDAGISKLVNGYIEHFPLPYSAQKLIINDMADDNHGNLWLATNQGLFMFDEKSYEKITNPLEQFSTHISSIEIDQNNSKWIGTDQGLYLIQGNVSKDISNLFHPLKDGVQDIFRDNCGNVWSLTDQGEIIKFDGISFEILNKSAGLKDVIPTKISADINGKIWFCTFGKGVLVYDYHSFNHFTTAHGLEHNIITYLFEDNQSRIWLGSAAGDVMRYENGQFSTIGQSDFQTKSSIQTILQDSLDNIWFVTKDNGLFKYADNEFHHYDHNQGFINKRVYSMASDYNGDIWVSSLGSGLAKFDGEQFINYSLDDGLSDSFFWCCFKDSKNNMWFGTAHNGIIKYDGQNFINISEEQGFFAKSIFCISEDSHGNIWFGAETDGIIRYDQTSFMYIPASEDNIDNNVYSIIEDKQKRLWISSENGIKLLNPTYDSNQKPISYKSTHYGKLDGLNAEDFGGLSGILTSNNELWWGSSSDLTVLDLSSFEPNSVKPEIQISQLTINDHPFHWNIDSTLDAGNLQHGEHTKFSNLPRGLELSHDKNHITIHFNGIEWNSPHKLTYRYILEGAQDNWNITSTKNYAEFFNLDHGFYTFKVQARGELSEWSDSATLSFTINPPWWQTWWAYLGYVIYGIFAIIAIIFWRTKNINARKIELELQVNSATTELKTKNQDLEIANAEITDSINYAKRIQKAILPEEDLVKNLFPESFILYKPKSVVAGDFYWIRKFKNKIMFAVADCTGHGVPGAMVSIICNSILNQTIEDFGVQETGKILDKIRETLISKFDKSSEQVYDGMDIALCCLDLNTRTLLYSGANIPLWIISEGIIMETRPDKQPIGKFPKPTPFTTYSVDIQKGDIIYLFSDGFIDQFGGDRGKKFKTTAFRKLLLSVCDKPMEEQILLLTEKFNSWKGNLEQLDDVCVFGVKF